MKGDRESLPELTFDGPSKDTRNAIRDAVASDLQKVVPRSLSTRIWHGLAAAVIVGALTMASFGPSAFSASLGRSQGLLLGGVIAVIAVLLASSAFMPKLENVGRDTRLLAVVSVVAAYSLYLVSTVKEPAWGSAMGGMAIGCGVRSLGAGVIAAGAMMWVWRRTDPWTPRLSGALIGACAGIIASTGVGLVCTGGHGGHMLIGHWLAVPLLAIAGFAVSRRVLAP